MRQARPPTPGMVPDHGLLFLRPDGRGQGSSALRSGDFGHRSHGGRGAIARGEDASGDLRLAHVTPPRPCRPQLHSASFRPAQDAKRRSRNVEHASRLGLPGKRHRSSHVKPAGLSFPRPPRRGPVRSSWRLSPARARIGAVDLYDGRTVPGPGHDHDDRIVARIALPVHDTRRHVAEVTGAGIEDLLTAGPELQPKRP